MNKKYISLRIGLRALTVLTLGLFAVQLSLLSYLWWGQQRTERSLFSLPSPAQFSNIVKLLDAAPPDERAVVVAALNSVALHVKIIQDKPSADGIGDPLAQIAFRPVINRYEEVLNSRKVIGMVGDGWLRHAYNAQFTPEGDVRAPFPMRVATMLESGEWLVLETPSLLDARLRRAPVGLFAGLVGLGVAILAIWTIWSAARPLQQMAGAARAFADTGKPSQVELRGGSDVKQLILNFNSMQERIARLMANRALMLSAMSHDIRTYLTRLRLRVEKMDEADRVAAEKTLDEIQALLNDTLAFAEAESGPSTDIPLDVAAMLRELCEHGPWPTEKVVCKQLDPAFVLGQESRLRRALMNVVANGVKYGKDVEVSLVVSQETAEINIADHGPGIPDSEKDRIFEPFFRLDRSRNRKIEGAGLGLAIAKTIATRMGGEIHVLDRTGGGSIVRIALPLTK